ncbi:hypothetical protein Afil01_43570 [Actinorhabdospora filicis]|uniref:Uncharacterized protein n=1 Tax=Actinorhabdospora filicis TaxID=1785913 RepID=A0A9W6WC98_9ACTN|nr:hypothetical protein [Actinorhabdospora filicis]GLZ79550.1 hypothetical protein Afil01_43570 [Actinorhabdospora filicis]
MGTFADHIAAQDDEVRSPDGNITARVTGGEIKGLAFKPGTYEQYSDAALELQLAGLSRLVWVARARARRDALRAAVDGPYDPEPMRPDSAQSRQALEEQQNLVVDVEMTHVTVRVEGGTSWRVKVKAGTVREVPEELFLREVATAATTAIGHWRARMHMVRQEAYGPSFIYKGMVPR